jgi:hypothetical protein
MNRLRVWGLSAALAAGVGGQAVAGDPYMSSEQTTLMSKIFSPKPSRPLGPSGPPAPATITAPLTPEALAGCLKAEQDAYLRRVNVCDKLRRVADETADPVLSRKAEELERQAEALYNARIAALGLNKSRATPRQSAETVKDPDTIGEPAPLKADQLIAPTPPVSGDVREVKP